MVKVKRKWAKRIAAVSLACVLGAGAVGALVGCSSDSKSNSDEMSVAWTSNAGEYNLDPTNNYMGWQGSYLGIYEQLFRIDANFDPQPMLAESAEMVNDTTWKITIREGVTFQNGNELNAQAVADCLNRTISMNERARNRSILPAWKLTATCLPLPPILLTLPLRTNCPSLLPLSSM